MKKLLSLAFGTIVLFSSCKKNDDNSSATSKTTLLTKAPWKVSSYGVDTNMDGLLTGTENETKACALDDTYTFSTTGAATYNPGTLICGSETAFTDTWRFLDNETILGYIDRWEIKTLTETKLELHRTGPASIAIRIYTR